MKKLLTLLLVIISVNVFGQKLSAPTGVVPLTQYSFYAKTSDSTLHAYSGGTWLWWKILSKQQGDALYQPIGSPSPLAYSLSTGYGLLGSSFNGSVARTFTADTASATGLVSKSRLATNLTGYVPNTRTITINGSTRDLSVNRVFNVGTVTSIGATAGTGISISGSPITSSGSITITNTNPAPIGIQDSLTKKANRTFDNVASGAIPISKLASSTISGVNLGGDLSNLSAGTGMSFTAYNGSVARTVNADTTVLQTVANFFPKGDTRYARTGATGTVTSVGLTMPVAFSVANSPVTTSGTLAVSAAGNATQYIRGDGELATLPSGGGGGSSVNYYMNGSVAASVATYKQMANTAVIGAGTDFPLVGNGLIAQFLTDSGNPNKLLIPSGAWNFEMFFSVSSSGGSQKFYVELLKYDGATFTSIASSSVGPEAITGGTAIDLYLTSLAVPETVLLTTDRLAVRVYIVDSSGGRTTTLHTENSHLSLAITTFSGGISALNGLTDNTQYFAVGSTGTDFNISSVSPTHTFNIPSASASNRGLITTGTQTIAGAKTFSSIITATSGIQTSSSDALASTGTGTVGNYITLQNTGGSLIYGIDSSTGGVTGTAYRSFIAYPNTRSFSLYRNGSGDVLTADASGNITINTLTNGLVKSTSGLLSNATAGTDYLTPTGSGSGLSGVVLTTTNQTGIAGNKSWTGTQTISNNVDISYGTTGVGALAVESTNSGGRALTVLGNSTIEPFVVSQQGAGLLAAFNKISGGSSTDQALIRNNGSIYTRGQLEVGNLLVGDSGDSVMVHRAIDLTVRRVGTTGTGSAVFSASPTFTGTVAMAALTGTGLVINNNGEALRAYGTSPNVSFYNAANTTRGGYVNHDGTNMNIVANVGSIVFGTAVSATGGATINDVFKIYSLSTSAGVVLQGYTGGLRIAVNGSGETGGTRGDLLAAAGDFSGALTGTSATFSGQITSTSGNNTNIFRSGSATTGYQYMDMQNTSGWGVFGVEGSTAGTILTGGSAYATVLKSVSSRNLEFGTNNTIRFALDGSTGAATFSGNTTSSSIANILGSDGGGKQLRFIGGVTTYNGLIANNENYANIIEITASSAVGTTTFNRNIAKFNLSDLSTTLAGALSGTSATFSGNVSVKNAALTTSVALSGSYFGYSSSYDGVKIGTSGAASLFFNVDVSANSSGSFSGNGSEYVWRNAGTFLTPNVSNNGYNKLFTWNSSGQMTVENAATFSSSVTATGFFESSDIRYKNILSRTTSKDGFDMISYTWKPELKRDKKIHFGYVAQEVQKVYPSQVQSDDKGFLSVNYTEVLVKKIAELETRIKQLEK